MADPRSQGPGYAVQEVLPARSAAEVHLYLDLHPCRNCGTPRRRDSQELRAGDGGGLISVYAGSCPGCGQQWSVAFALPASQPPAGCIGGAEPSAIIGPGQWLMLSDRAASIPAGSGPLSPQDRARLARAADAADEVAKFIPRDGDRVPDEAFTSGPERALHDAWPSRFGRADLTGRAKLYRTAACQAREPRS